MGRFEGRLRLELAEDHAGRPLTRGGRSLWIVDAPLAYDDGANRITVPVGLITDLASIPRGGWNVLPPDGPWAKAAVIHDFLYATKGTGVVSDGSCGITKPGGYTRAEADKVLDDAMAALGVGEADRVAIYEGVRAGGEIGWGD